MLKPNSLFSLIEMFLIASSFHDFCFPSARPPPVLLQREFDPPLLLSDLSDFQEKRSSLRLSPPLIFLYERSPTQTSFEGSTCVVHRLPPFSSPDVDGSFSPPFPSTLLMFTPRAILQPLKVYRILRSLVMTPSVRPQMREVVSFFFARLPSTRLPLSFSPLCHLRVSNFSLECAFFVLSFSRI